jgi:hypothetical protein
LEIELLRTKQELGEALNSVYEYEQTSADREMLSLGRSMAFGAGRGPGSGHNADSEGEHNNSGGGLETGSRSQQMISGSDPDGGSGSTIKKMSKKDKIKNFFKKKLEGTHA